MSAAWHWLRLSLRFQRWEVLASVVGVALLALRESAVLGTLTLVTLIAGVMVVKRRRPG